MSKNYWNKDRGPRFCTKVVLRAFLNVLPSDKDQDNIVSLPSSTNIVRKEISKIKVLQATCQETIKKKVISGGYFL